jgi:hypothetical protein
VRGGAGKGGSNHGKSEQGIGLRGATRQIDADAAEGKGWEGG